MKDEKILKKIDKLLKAYGVEDETERQNFLNDVQDSKYDEEEIVEENDKVEKPIEENNDVEEPTETEETEKVEETEQVEEPTDDLPIENGEPEKEEPQEQVETETPNEDEVADVGEEVVGEEEQPELPLQEEQPMDQVNNEPDAVETLKGELDEMKKSNEGLVARLEHLESILSKLGVPTEEQFGESPISQKGVEDNSDMAEINRKRLGY